MRHFRTALMLGTAPFYDTANEGSAGNAGASGAGAGQGGAAAGGGAGDGGGAAGGGDAGAGAAGAAGAGSKDGANGSAGGGAESKTPAAQNPDADYVDDPAKTADENKAARTAHDQVRDARKPLLGAPEKYADLQVPEGMNLDQKAWDGIQGMARTLNLSQTAVDQLIGIQKDLYARAATEQATAFAATKREWETQRKADPEVGGANYEANNGIATAARTQFFDADTQKLIDDTGIGDHPGFHRAMVKIGKAMGEGRTQSNAGDPGTGQGASTESVYNNPTSDRVRKKK